MPLQVPSDQAGHAVIVTTGGGQAPDTLSARDMIEALIVGERD